VQRIVLYHAGCDDGFGAAWAAWLSLDGQDAQYRPVNYGEPLPEIPDGALVTIVDFSYPRDVLLALRERCLVHVLDHHKTAAEDLAGLDFAVFDMNKSGARLSWEHFHPGVEMPPLLAHVEDRDLWRFALPETREISAWLRSWPRDFERWSWAHRTVFFERAIAVAEGAAILRANAQHTDSHVRAAKLREFDGEKVPCVNATMLRSEIGAALNAKHPDAPFSLTYFDREDGRRVWSLRTSHEDVDVAAVARRHGGGGHRGAAGFSEPTAPSRAE